MASGGEAIREDAVGSKLTETLKLPSSEEILPKGDDSESQVAPKVESEASDKTKDLQNKKPEESEDEVGKGCSSVTPELEEFSVKDEGKSPSESEDKSTGDDKGSLTDGSVSSLQLSEGKSGPYESARNSLPSSDGNSGSYESAPESCPLVGKNISDGYVRVSLIGSTANLTATPSVGGNDLEETVKVASQNFGETPSEEDGKKIPSKSATFISEKIKPRVDESNKSKVQSSDGSTEKSASENDGKNVDDGDKRPLSASPVAVEDGQKRKAAQSGTTKRFLGLSFGSKSADKPKTPKKSGASDKIKSPKKSDEPSEKLKSPKKSDDPNKPSEKTKSPKKSKSSKKLDGLDESTDKIKSPEKSDKTEEPPKKSKKSSGPEKVKSPKKSSGLEPLKKSKGSKKCGEQEESTTDTPIKESPSRFFRRGVAKMVQKFSPGDSKESKETKRPTCSSFCNPDFYVKSPELSPIGNERHFSASFLGSCLFPPELKADRIDYSKLAEDRIIATFLTSHECYDVMPISGKVIVLSVDLLVKNAFSALVTNEINAAPLWDSGLHDFVGFLTITDFINVLQHYFYSSPEDIKDIENQSISTWRRITKVPNRFVKVNGSDSLSEAARLLVQEGIHRIPVFDEKRQCVLFVLTRKRLLQYLSFYLFDKLEQFNIKAPTFFKKTIGEIGVGTYENIATVTESTKVIDALDLFVNRRVSSLPVVDEDGVLKDIFGKMDVFALAKEQMYHNLEITVYEVVRKGVPRECAIICTLDESFGTVIQRFISTKSHRIVVVDEIRSVVGIISLSDLLKFLVLEPLAAIALEAGAGSASDIIEEGAEGAVGGADGDGDAVFNDDSESGKDESLALNSMKDLNISKDNEDEPVTEDVSKSE